MENLEEATQREAQAREEFLSSIPSRRLGWTIEEVEWAVKEAKGLPTQAGPKLIRKRMKEHDLKFIRKEDCEPAWNEAMSNTLPKHLR